MNYHPSFRLPTLCLMLQLPTACLTAVSDTSTSNSAGSADVASVTSASTAASASETTSQPSNGNTNVAGRPPTGLGRYTLVGRFVTQSPNDISFGLLGSRIGLNFTGSSVTVMMWDLSTDYLDVVLDGNRQTSPLTINPNAVAQPYLIASDLPAGNHTLWLTKRTEVLKNGFVEPGIIHLIDVVLDKGGSFLPPPPTRPRRLEFIGDSGWSGYGSDAIMGAPGTSFCDYSAGTQNALKSVPGYTADFLNADAVNASVTGKGVYLSVYDPTNPLHTLPVLNELTYPTGPQYTFSPTGTDAVLLSVGGDDLWGNNGTGYFPNPSLPSDSNVKSAADPSGSDPNYFIKPMAQFLVQINKHYPNVTIVCVVSAAANGQDVTSLTSALQQAIALAKTQGVPNAVVFNYFAGDPTYHTYDDIALQLKLYYGCYYHPSDAGAKWLSYRLATFLAAQIGWEPPPVTPPMAL